jgi:mannose-6-phosphate isomerase-like protein (cupin superfamily)
MSSPAHKSLGLTVAEALQAAVSLDLPAIQARLEASRGGVHVAHSAAAFEIRVEVLNSPGPGAMRRERTDTLYVALDGNGVLGVENGDPLALARGEAAVVPAGARHVVFGNPRLSLLVVSAPGWVPVAPLAACRRP